MSELSRGFREFVLKGLGLRVEGNPRYGTDPTKYMLSAHTPDFTDQQSVMLLGSNPNPHILWSERRQMTPCTSNPKWSKSVNYGPRWCLYYNVGPVHLGYPKKDHVVWELTI